MRLIYVNSSKVTKLEQKMNNSESFLLLLKNLLKCTYEVLLPSQRHAIDKLLTDYISMVMANLTLRLAYEIDLTSYIPMGMTNLTLSLTDDIDKRQTNIYQW